MPGRWQTRALAGDYHRRTVLQRCIRNEQQCNQHQTYRCKKGESWHCRVPTARALSTLTNSQAEPSRLVELDQGPTGLAHFSAGGSAFPQKHAWKKRNSAARDDATSVACEASTERRSLGGRIQGCPRALPMLRI